MSKRSEFRSVWNRLAEQGVCDALGSRQWARILTDWQEANEPLPPKPFIMGALGYVATGADDEWIMPGKEESHVDHPANATPTGSGTDAAG
jgi:hypothetical protein